MLKKQQLVNTKPQSPVGIELRFLHPTIDYIVAMDAVTKMPVGTSSASIVRLQSPLVQQRSAALFNLYANQREGEGALSLQSRTSPSRCLSHRRGPLHEIATTVEQFESRQSYVIGPEHGEVLLTLTEDGETMAARPVLRQQLFVDGVLVRPEEKAKIFSGTTLQFSLVKDSVCCTVDWGYPYDCLA
jgi:hypothetical protein